MIFYEYLANIRLNTVRIQLFFANFPNYSLEYRGEEIAPNLPILRYSRVISGLNYYFSKKIAKAIKSPLSNIQVMISTTYAMSSGVIL